MKKLFFGTSTTRSFLASHNKSFVKVIFIALLCMVTLNTVHGQAMLIGGVAYGTDVEDMGLQVRALYEISDRINVSADVIYYLDGIENFSYYGVKCQSSEN